MNDSLSNRELVLLRRAAEDAIHAANPRYSPFIDAVANPLVIRALVDMAIRSLDVPSGAQPPEVSPAVADERVSKMLTLLGEIAKGEDRQSRCANADMLAHDIRRLSAALCPPAAEEEEEGGKS